MTTTPTTPTTDRTADQEDAPMTVQSHKHRAQRSADRRAVDDRDNPPTVRPRRTLELAGATPKPAMPADGRAA